jgi:hypothetical protein
VGGLRHSSCWIVTRAAFDSGIRGFAPGGHLFRHQLFRHQP